MPREQGRLVGAGSFRVDSKRAAEVLRERQLADSFWRPALWVRCAAACGASTFEIKRTATGMTIRFDGRPIPPAVLEQPFASLVDGQPDAAERWFGWALLHTAVERMRVSAASGRGADRASYAYPTDGSTRAGGRAPGDDTVIEVRWGMFGQVLMSAPPGWILGVYSFPNLGLEWTADPAPFPITCKEVGASFSQAPWERRPRREAAVTAAGRRRLRVAGPVRKACLRLSTLGTVVHRTTLRAFALPLEVDVDDPDLSVDASLASAVRDEAFEAASAAGRTAAVRYALAFLARHEKAMALTGGLLLKEPALRWQWVIEFGLARGDEGAIPTAAGLKRLLMALRGRSGDRLRVVRCAESVKVLREAARLSLSTPEADGEDPVRTALWRTGLFFSTAGRPLSLLELTGGLEGLRPWKQFHPPTWREAEAHWVLSPLDTVYLRKRFPERRGLVR
ncbi:MAG: hypothetical protein HYZ75_07310 [Elusimicrobia bacterium]|nr:hypothetical protein [Elusimicrobiota bacterium]